MITSADAGRGATVEETAIPATDALVTDVTGVLLALFFADCLPVFFVDPERPAVGIAHAGWRGMVAGVLENTIDTMGRQYGSRREKLIAAVGPGISQRYFEVGTEVASHFPIEVVSLNERTGKPHIDLSEAARLRLIKAGISAVQIDVARECTHDQPDRFFSHRRDNGKTGRMGAFIGLGE